MTFERPTPRYAPKNRRRISASRFSEYTQRMSSRYSNPLAVRLPRSERAAVKEYAALQGMSVSALLKEALRWLLDGVHPGVHRPEGFALVGFVPEATFQASSARPLFVPRKSPSRISAANDDNRFSD